MMILIDNIEKYFEEIEIERKTITRDEYNAEKIVWNSHLIIQGRLRKLNGNELVQSDQLQSVGSHRLYCRLQDIAKETDRILYKGKYYEIIDVNDVMNFGDLMQIECEDFHQ